MSTRSSRQNSGRRVSDFPESQVGFPERNDVTRPVDEMERVHVDMETLNISRKNSQEVDRELSDQLPAEE